MSNINQHEIDFVNFMNAHRLSKKDPPKIETHTLMGPLHKELCNYAGRFKIVGPDYEKFIELYAHAVHTMDMYLVERPCKKAVPVVIDVDFITDKKYKNDRQYLDKHIKGVVKVYNKLFEQYLNISTQDIKAFVFEKPTPTYEEKVSGSRCKDGFHIIYPEVPLNTKKRFFFYHKAKEQIIKNKLFSDIPFKNSYDEILDISVVNANGILMYGSKKPEKGREPYALTKIYNYDLTPDSTDDYDDDVLISYLSLQQYSEEDDIQFKDKRMEKKLCINDFGNNSDSDSDDSESESDDSGSDSDFSNSKLDEIDDILGNYIKKDKKNNDDSSDDNTDSDYSISSSSVSSDSEEEAPKRKNKHNKHDKYDKHDKHNKYDKNDKHNKHNKHDKYDKHNKYDEHDGHNKYDNYEEYNNINKTNKRNNEPLTGKELDIKMASQLVMILKKSRSDDYYTWIRIGWSLASVSHDLLPVFMEFSKKSKKYDGTGKECKEIWKKCIQANYYGCTIATIYWYARKDNYEGYLKILRSQINPLLVQAKSGTHDDIANVVYQMYKPVYKCVSINNNVWYEFQEDYWVKLDSAYTLKEKIHNEVVKEFFALHSIYVNIGERGGENIDQDECVKQSGKIQKIYEKLKNNGFVKQVIDCCCAKFYDQKFEKSLNENRLLLGFTNGVYDLDAKLFRRGSPDDLISMTVGYDYKEYSMDDPIVKKIMKYFSEVQREEPMRDYVLRLISSFLDGRVKDQKFILWTGSGCHAKDEEIMMYDKTFKKSQDIQLGDKIFGSDGRERYVNVLYKGKYDMYNIYALDDKMTTFKVTGNHRLALRCHYKPQIVSSYDDVYDVNVYWLKYHALIGDNLTELVELTKKFYTMEDAEAFLKNLENSEECVDYGKIIPISIEQYQTIKPEVLKYYKLTKYDQNISTDVDFLIEKNLIQEDYYGWELDGDKRYVMANGYVTYNSNGKSTTVDLIKLTLGDYAGTLKKEIVTRKVTGSGNATPDLADKVGKRFLVIQEPEKDDQIYVGAMKELSAGNDEIPARALYGNPFYYRPQFKMILCCNKLPHIPSNDGGTWRRLRVTPWESQFVSPDDYKKSELLPHQFFKNDNLMDDMKLWTAPFIWLLLHEYYPAYCKGGLGEPEKVKQYTNKYKKDSDTYLEYLADNTEKTGDEKDSESVAVVYKLFKAWYKDSYSNNPPPLKEFTGYLEGNGYLIERGHIKGIRLTLGD